MSYDNNQDFKPVLTEEQFDGLHHDLDKTRSTSKTVKVDKQALTNLLMDHSSLWDILGIE